MAIVVAAERLPELLAIHPDVVVPRRLQPPASRLREDVDARRGDRRAPARPADAHRPGHRGRARCVARYRVRTKRRRAAALEAEGVVLRGRFYAWRATDLEWCDRALLARIHRYTLNRLRAEIEPVSPPTSCASCSAGSTSSQRRG